MNTENYIEHTLIPSVSLPKVFLHSIIFEVLKGSHESFLTYPQTAWLLSFSNIATECHKSFEKSLNCLVKKCDFFIGKQERKDWKTEV